MGINMIYRCVLVEGFYYTVMFVNGDFMRVRGSLRWVVLQFNVTGGLWWLFAVNFQQQLGGFVGELFWFLEVCIMRINEGILDFFRNSVLRIWFFFVLSDRISKLLAMIRLPHLPLMTKKVLLKPMKPEGCSFSDIKPENCLTICLWSQKCRNSRSNKSKKRWNC